MPSQTLTKPRPQPRDPYTKPFAWSYSALKNFETCPKRHWHLDLARDVAEDESDQLAWGNTLHAAMAAAIGTDDNKQRHPRDQIDEAPLPVELEAYAPWVNRIRNSRESGAHVFTELKYAISRDFKPVSWFADNAWYRAVVDVLVLTKDWQHGAAFDWKTGARKEDPAQLLMNSLAIFLHHPGLKAIRSEFVWLKEMKVAAPFTCISRADYQRDKLPELWSSVAPRVKLLEAARANKDYPARPSGLCKRYCPVTSCPHHGG